MSTITSRYSSSPESQLESDLNAIKKCKDSLQIQKVFDTGTRLPMIDARALKMKSSKPLIQIQDTYDGHVLGILVKISFESDAWYISTPLKDNLETVRQEALRRLAGQRVNGHKRSLAEIFGVKE